jgi:hypothetical protein
MKSPLFNEGLSDMSYLPSIIQMIKPRRIRRAGNMSCMEERRGAYGVLVG